MKKLKTITVCLLLLNRLYAQDTNIKSNPHNSLFPDLAPAGGSYSSAGIPSSGSNLSNQKIPSTLCVMMTTEVHPLKEYFKYDNSKATKQQTADWIVGKINQYAKAYWPDETFIGSDIAEDVLYLRIRKHEYKDGKDQPFEKTVSIPLNNLSEVSIAEGTLFFITFDETILGTYKGMPTKMYSISFETGKEDDIIVRFIKAFVHLDKFYWKKVGKETF